MSRRAPVILLFSVLLLVVLGFVMQLSTAGYSMETRTDSWAALRKHTVFCVAGLLGGAVLMRMDYRNWIHFAKPVYWLSIVLLLLCFAPVIGKDINGARRWIGYGALQLQASEPARLGVIMALAAFCTVHGQRRLSFLHGYLLPLLLLALPVALIALEVDLGAAVLLFAAGSAVLFLAGSRLIYLIGSAAIGITILAAAITLIPNRVGRVTAFVQLWKETPADSKEAARFAQFNFQQEQGLIALGSGGLAGRGLGDGRQKRFYLPYCHTDFVFPVVGEELGILGTLGTVSLFAAIAVAGLGIASTAADRFGALLAGGLVLLIVFQAAINIGVTTACLPNKGMPLPFVSYGGSNLCSCLLAVGALLSIHRQARPAELVPEPVLGRPRLTASL
jgi:cell division protein FtsW